MGLALEIQSRRSQYMLIWKGLQKVKVLARADILKKLMLGQITAKIWIIWVEWERKLSKGVSIVSKCCFIKTGQLLITITRQVSARVREEANKREKNGLKTMKSSCDQFSIWVSYEPAPYSSFNMLINLLILLNLHITRLASSIANKPSFIRVVLQFNASLLQSILNILLIIRFLFLALTEVTLLLKIQLFEDLPKQQWLFTQKFEVHQQYLQWRAHFVGCWPSKLRVNRLIHVL